MNAQLQLSDSLDASLRYSFMDAKDRLEGRWVDRRWSQRHTANAGLTWQSGALTVSAAVTWHSGWRSSRLPDFVPEGVVRPVASVLNNTGLRDYFSLDIGARYHWKVGRTRLEVYADISNITDRQNEAGIDFDTEEVAGGTAIFADRESVLGRVPSVGATLSF